MKYKATKKFNKIKNPSQDTWLHLGRSNYERLRAGESVELKNVANWLVEDKYVEAVIEEKASEDKTKEIK